MQNDAPRLPQHRGGSMCSTSTTGDDTSDRLADSVLEELLEDAALGVVFEIHRAARRGLLALEDGDTNPNFPAAPPPALEYPLVDAPDLDVFGQPPVKKQHECVCPSCHRNLAASRFAPHLEKCKYDHEYSFCIIIFVVISSGMGMGRNSSRIASRRIANSSKEGNGNGAGGSGGNGNNAFVTGLLSDDEDDADWTMGGSERKRKKRDKHLGKRSKGSKVLLSDIFLKYFKIYITNFSFKICPFIMILLQE
jgi:SAGA-associated factor 11